MTGMGVAVSRTSNVRRSCRVAPPDGLGPPRGAQIDPLAWYAA